MFLLEGGSGEYFIRGEYIAMRAGDGGPWRVSKVEHDPADTKRATLTKVGEWWTAEDATASIDWHTRRDREESVEAAMIRLAKEGAVMAPEQMRSDIERMESNRVGHPPTWPGYIDRR